MDAQYTSNELCYDKLPKLVFGDESCVLSQCDKTFGFDEWKELIVKEFEVLKHKNAMLIWILLNANKCKNINDV